MKIAVNVFNIFLIIFFILVVVVNLYTTKFNKEVFGYSYLQVLTGSMDDEPTNYKIKTLKVNDFIIVEKINNYEDLAIGDVITFKMNEGIYKGLTVSHRIVDIDSSIITTKGDANTKTETLDINKDIIYGKVIFNNLIVGNILKVIKSKYFLIPFISIPCIFIIIKEGFEIQKIIRKKGECI